jgi:uncharacterized protein (TIGR02266 family)
MGSIHTSAAMRRSERAHTSLPVRWLRGPLYVNTVAVLVNEHGLFLRTSEKTDVGVTILLQLLLPDGTLDVAATTRFVGTSEAGTGLGAEFQDLDKEARERWTTYYQDTLANSTFNPDRVVFPTPSEKRDHVRVPLVLEVSLYSESCFYAGVTRDLGQGGIFVATDNPPVKGTVVRLTLHLPGRACTFPIEGEVAWIRHPWATCEGAPAGCGIKWRRLSEAAAQAIAEFVFAEARDLLLYEE